ncbi:hypothetical protein FA15DRAFT_705328 [Coprinopsis marcescibilis]|uniref:Uncharacterized protein n=1 Tax=Coprinopsis marcescibilis TaxID=230819 RepID=A0A5C3KTM0_COPMA|nr:hypothetical protein FA15DRAFT_705328 [Coprinopsis marcescibilis]
MSLLGMSDLIPRATTIGGFVHLGDTALTLPFANATMRTAFAGIHIFIAVYGLFLFLQTPAEKRKGRATYIVLSFVILAVFCTASAVSMASVLKFLMHDEAAGEDDKSILLLSGFVITKARPGFWERNIAGYLISACVWICDASLLYRCFVLWRDKVYICVLPILAYLASIAIREMLTYTPEALCEAASNYRHQWSAAWVLSSVSVNVMTTSLIAYRLVTAARGISAILPSNWTTATTDKMIIFLVEAALPTAVFGLLYVVSVLIPLEAPPHRTEAQGGMVVAYTLVQVSYTLFTCFVVLAPQLIILRVTSGRSWTNSGELTGAASQVMSRPAEPLTFAGTQRPVGSSRISQGSFTESFDTVQEPDPAHGCGESNRLSRISFTNPVGGTEKI